MSTVQPPDFEPPMTSPLAEEIESRHCAYQFRHPVECVAPKGRGAAAGLPAHRSRLAVKTGRHRGQDRTSDSTPLPCP